MLIFSILTVVGFAIVSIFYILMLINIVSDGKIMGRLFHRLFNLHIPADRIDRHTLYHTATCKYCGKKIIKFNFDWYEY